MKLEIKIYNGLTDEEKRLGLSSSVNSEGFVGRINRFIARMTGEHEVDIVGFASDLWGRKLIGPSEDSSI